jgi:hypothetical protein
MVAEELRSIHYIVIVLILLALGVFVLMYVEGAGAEIINIDFIDNLFAANFGTQ